MKDCPVCDGDGECRNDFHASTIGNLDPVTFVNDLLDESCPACGNDIDNP